MSFFKHKEIKLAKTKSYSELREGYLLSEHELKEAAKSGKESKLNAAMKKHHDFEYALLYRETPKFNKK